MNRPKLDSVLFFTTHPRKRDILRALEGLPDDTPIAVIVRPPGEVPGAAALFELYRDDEQTLDMKFICGQPLGIPLHSQRMAAAIPKD